MSRHSQVSYAHTARGLLRFEIEIFHDELNKYQLIRGDNQEFVIQKANAKMAEWDEMWARRSEREQRNQNIDDKKKTAEERSQEARQNLFVLEHILKQGLDIDPTLNWDLLKNHSDYSVPKPKKSVLENPKPSKIPEEPKRTWPEFTVKLSIFDKISRSRREQKERGVEIAFNDAHSEWESNKAQTQKNYEDKMRQLNIEKQKKEGEYSKAVANWEKDRAEYLKKCDEGNAAIDKRARLYETGDTKEVLDYCDAILTNSIYPDYFPKTFELDYNPENKLLLADYQFPSLASIPTLKDVRYVQSTDKFTETNISETQLNKLYDNLLYEITLRTVYELFKADKADAISSIVLNGYVKSLSSSTGKEINPCVLSVQTNKLEFMQITLANVDPKACFKQLKGVGSSKLHSLTSIAPILTMNRVDKRFIESYGVEDRLDGAVNLALMDWEDFEHLVRELFEQEYGGPGNEVRVTRASRDYGVDAVVFDSDPIRGGKIVIQAKRYTNTVGVSAVRDLYGTVMNEGAMKGILVTTSDYGPESYEFSRNKPLTLLNGSNLLYLLEKHGHKAKIDLQEAKRLMAQGET